jgi:hypothetical protein
MSRLILLPLLAGLVALIVRHIREKRRAARSWSRPLHEIPEVGGFAQ